MAEDQERKTELLDQLEEGPWPSFVTEIKKARQKNPACDDLLSASQLCTQEKKGQSKFFPLPVLRDEVRMTTAHRIDRRLGQLFGFDVPLIGEEGLYDFTGAITMRNDMRVQLNLLYKSSSFHKLNNTLTRFAAGLSIE